MTDLFDIKQNDLEKMSIKDYFKSIESSINSGISIDKLTAFFTFEDFVETKPYLIRRKLIPFDKRFKQIELVYKNKDKVDAIVWELTISLSQLIDIFGIPIIYHEPYSESTAIVFKSSNHDISIVTRHQKWITILKNNVFEYLNEDNQKSEIVDPEFSFVQFNLVNKC